MCVQALAVNGAKVYIVGRTEEKLQTVAETHGKDISGEIIPLVGDITSKKDIENLVKEIESREKCLCILISTLFSQSERFHILTALRVVRHVATHRCALDMSYEPI